MKVIYNDYIPFKGFKCLNLYGVLFARNGTGKMMPRDYNHEKVHSQQMLDFCKWMPIGGTIFYIIYFFEWVAKLFVYGRKAYSNLSFEKEAYDNQYDFDYLKNRKHFAQWRKK